MQNFINKIKSIIIDFLFEEEEINKTPPKTILFTIKKDNTKDSNILSESLIEREQNGDYSNSLNIATDSIIPAVKDNLLDKDMEMPDLEDLELSDLKMPDLSTQSDSLKKEEDDLDLEKENFKMPGSFSLKDDMNLSKLPDLKMPFDDDKNTPFDFNDIDLDGLDLDSDEEIDKKIKELEEKIKLEEEKLK